METKWLIKHYVQNTIKKVKKQDKIKNKVNHILGTKPEPKWKEGQ